MNQEHPTVVKVGTGVLTREDGKLDQPALLKLVTALSGLIEGGERVILVSSGAVGAGTRALGLKEYPQDRATKQACAAVGQARLIRIYENLFTYFGLSAAQVLLTAYDLDTEKRRGKVLATFENLLRHQKIIPIVNENDSVATSELTVGDNDVLSARVANLTGARRLILLTSVDGLLHPDTKELIPSVKDVSTVLNFGSDSKNKFSIGGMASKLKAVKFAVDNGIETIIAHGEKPERLAEIVKGGGVCTRFAPTPRR